MPKKLYIYDNSSIEDKMQALGRRFGDDENVIALPVERTQEVRDGLDALVADRVVFDRLLFQTHGDTGLIFFGDERIDSPMFKTIFANRDYDKLFPNYSRVYFDGCNVADGGRVGQEFLRAAGRVFLKGMGGEVSGWTSGGFGLPGTIPFLGGHTFHLTGDLVRIKFDHDNPDGIEAPAGVLTGHLVRRP